MRKKVDGVLSIEAAISLTMLIFVVMFVLDIGYIYRAQNMVYHAMLQTAKTASLYDYEVNGVGEPATEQVINQFMSLIGIGTNSVEEQLKQAVKNENVPQIAQIIFKGSVAEKQDEAKYVLNEYNVKKINFEKSKFVEEWIDNTKDKDIVIVAEYEVRLVVPVFGLESIHIKQSTRSRLWGYGHY